MSLQTKTIGRMPTDHGPYDPELAYGKKFQCTLFGCSWESMHDNNNTAPAVWDGGDTITPNLVDWKKVSGSYEAWLMNHDKPAASEQYPFNGMGRVRLQKNIVDGVNTLTQAMLTQQNTIYVIQYDFTLTGDVTVPANCVLEFNGGSLSGGTINCNNCYIKGDFLKGNACYKNLFKTNYVDKKVSNFNNIYIVSDTDTLNKILVEATADSPSIMFLKGNVFTAANVETNFVGTIMPYPGYKPIIIGSNAVLNSPTISGGKYVYPLGRNLLNNLFYAFDESGNPIEINKLSSYTENDIAYTDGAVSYDASTKLVTIPMTDEVKGLISNISSDILSNATLLLKIWYKDFIITGIYTDSDYIYGYNNNDENISDFQTVERQDGKFSNLRYDIYNLPLDNQKGIYIDKDNNVISNVMLDTIIVSDVNNILIPVSGGTKLDIYDITFKGASQYAIYSGSAYNKNYYGCTFEHTMVALQDYKSGIVNNCLFKNIGCSAIKVWGRNAKITNSYFNRIGIIKAWGFAVQISGGANIVSNNKIVDFAYAGISTGTSDNNEAEIIGNIIENDEFYQNPEKWCMLDGGGIYVYYKNTRVYINANIIRNISSRNVETTAIGISYRGIFLDDGASNVTIINNCIYNIRNGYAIDSRIITNKQTGNPYYTTNNNFLKNVCIGHIRIERDSDYSDYSVVVENNRFAIGYKFVSSGGVNFAYTSFCEMWEKGNTINIARRSAQFNNLNLKCKELFNISEYSLNKRYHLGHFAINATQQDTEKVIHINLSKLPNVDARIFTSIDICVTTAGSTSHTYKLPIDIRLDSTGTSIRCDTPLYQFKNRYSLVKSINSVSDNSFYDKEYFEFDIVLRTQTYCTYDISISDYILYSNIGPFSLTGTASYVSAGTTYPVAVDFDKYFYGTHRPTDTVWIGFVFFDTTINKPIWYKGKDEGNHDIWVDATGTQV